MELVRRAFLLAYEAHKSQRYNNDPYLVHLFDTYNVLIEYGQTEGEVLAAGLLHDVIEDTPLNYRQVMEATNKAVAEIVYACTDELGRSREERKARTSCHLREWTEQHGTTALTVKLADWIANARRSLMGSPRKLQMYEKDWPEFYQFRTFFPAEQLAPMWNHLKELLVAEERE